MSAEKVITKGKLDLYLKELAKEFRKRNGLKMPAEEKADRKSGSSFLKEELPVIFNLLPARPYS